MTFYDDFGPLATPGDAHREWHLNSGVPMGQPGCPQDACHLPDDPEMWSDYDEAAEEARFGEAYNPVDMGFYDDDPNPYHGDMGYDDGIPF